MTFMLMINIRLRKGMSKIKTEGRLWRCAAWIRCCLLHKVALCYLKITEIQVALRQNVFHQHIKGERTS